MDQEDKIENQENSNLEIVVHDKTKENENDKILLIRKKNDSDEISQNSKINGNRNLESGYRNKRKISRKNDKNISRYDEIEMKSKHSHDLMTVAMEAFSSKVSEVRGTYNTS